MDIQPRPYAEIIDETPCPEDQAVGCESCQGDSECLIRIHDEDKCGHQLEVYGFKCEICHHIEMQDDGDRGDWLYEQEKDRRMMEGEE